MPVLKDGSQQQGLYYQIPGAIIGRMAPTIFRAHGFRFFFFSREEPRLHVHVNHAEGEAKFWMTPGIALAQNVGLSGKALRQAQALIEEHEDDIRNAWQQHFGS